MNAVAHEVDAALPKHLRSKWLYLCTIPNLMDYVRILVYIAAIYGHVRNHVAAMPLAIM